MLLAVRVVGWTHLESLQSTQEARITRLRLEQLLQHSYLRWFPSYLYFHLSLEDFRDTHPLSNSFKYK